MYLSLTKIIIYISLFLGFFLNSNVHSSYKNTIYSKKNISNYFSGVISLNNYKNELAVKYFENVSNLQSKHDQFNQRLVFSLVQTRKIPETFLYLKKLEKKKHKFL